MSEPAAHVELLRRAIRGALTYHTHPSRGAATIALDALAAELEALRAAWDETGKTLEEALEQADNVIAVMTSYMDDLLDRARAVNAPQRARVDAGPFALYREPPERTGGACLGCRRYRIARQREILNADTVP